MGVYRIKYEIREKDGKQAIFKDGTQVSAWFDNIWANGLIAEESEYYLAKNNGRHAMFHKSGLQITDWLDTEVEIDEKKKVKKVKVGVLSHLRYFLLNEPSKKPKRERNGINRWI